MRNNCAFSLVECNRVHQIKPQKKKKRSLDKHNWISKTNNAIDALHIRVSVQGVKSIGGQFACLCRGFDFYEVKKIYIFIFQKEKGNTFSLLIIFIVKSLQKEQNM